MYTTDTNANKQAGAEHGAAAIATDNRAHAARVSESPSEPVMARHDMGISSELGNGASTRLAWRMGHEATQGGRQGRGSRDCQHIACAGVVVEVRNEARALSESGDLQHVVLRRTRALDRS